MSDKPRERLWPKARAVALEQPEIQMPRVVKHSEIRRTEILDAAFKMFVKRGYDSTSLNDIISSAGFSKGMFYHHFASKEVLLEALFDRITDQTYTELDPIIKSTNVDPKTKLQQILDRGAEIRLQSVEFGRGVFVALLQPENKELYHRIGSAWTARMRPIFTRIIKEGVEAGAFRTQDPEGVGDLILQMGIAARYLVEQGMIAQTTRERDAAISALDTRIKFQAQVIGRCLDLPDDTFTIGPPDFANRFLKALNPIGYPTKM